MGIARRREPKREPTGHGQHVDKVRVDGPRTTEAEHTVVRRRRAMVVRIERHGIARLHGGGIADEVQDAARRGFLGARDVAVTRVRVVDVVLLDVGVRRADDARRLHFHVRPRAVLVRTPLPRRPLPVGVLVAAARERAPCPLGMAGRRTDVVLVMHRLGHVRRIVLVEVARRAVAPRVARPRGTRRVDAAERTPRETAPRHDRACQRRLAEGHRRTDRVAPHRRVQEALVETASGQAAPGPLRVLAVLGAVETAVEEHRPQRVPRPATGVERHVDERAIRHAPDETHVAETTRVEGRVLEARREDDRHERTPRKRRFRDVAGDFHAGKRAIDELAVARGNAAVRIRRVAARGFAAGHGGRRRGGRRRRFWRRSRGW
ncbi:MAG: hypothetical protein CMF70_06755 [Magnetovibrio sp.]|nr:hypothetical protein [Magnetovibrio sp.]